MLVYPEALEKQELDDLTEMISPVEKFFSEQGANYLIVFSNNAIHFHCVVNKKV